MWLRRAVPTNRSERRAEAPLKAHGVLSWLSPWKGQKAYRLDGGAMSWHSGDSAIVLPDRMHCFRRKAAEAERIYFSMGSYFFRFIIVSQGFSSANVCAPW